MSIYVDWPDQLDLPSSLPPVPETAPQRQPNRWRYRFPWVKTAVSAPIYDDELTIDNQTDFTWQLWHDYHSLGLVPPRGLRRRRLVKAGTISARRLPAPTGEEYIFVSLNPTAAEVRIVDLSAGESLHALEIIEGVAPEDGGGGLGGEGLAGLREEGDAREGRRPRPESLPPLTPIEELAFSTKTENALKRIGITTVGQLQDINLRELEAFRGGRKAYYEVVRYLIDSAEE
jgi:hypothetical protein